MRRASVTFLAVLGALAGAAPAHATFPGANGKIAYTDTTAPGSAQVFTINPDGTDRTQLTNSYVAAAPAWSSDGTKIAFVDVNSANPNGRIAVMNADGSGYHLLTGNGNVSPSWSPDGTKIAFETNRHANDMTYAEQLYVMNADGTNEHRLTNTVDTDIYPSWSPDGQKILFERDENITTGNVTIRTINPDGSGNGVVATNVGQVPDWSPDGNRIVFTSLFSGRQIKIMNRDGTMITAVPNAVGEGPVFSPDGDFIAFENETGLQTIRADGTDLATVVPRGSGPGGNPDWQPIVSNPTYPHPQSAPSVSVSLVPTFKQCGTGSNPANSQHGGSLSVWSCNPPQPGPVVGTTTAKLGPSAVGSFDYAVLPGADVRVKLNLSDVESLSGADYDPRGVSGIDIFVVSRVRITDGNSCTPAPCSGPNTASATATDVDFGPFPVDCVPIGDPSTPPGSTCNVDTTLNAVAPGSFVSGKQSVLQFFRVRVLDSQSNGPDDPPGVLFAQQGVFVP